MIVCPRCGGTTSFRRPAVNRGCVSPERRRARAEQHQRAVLEIQEKGCRACQNRDDLTEHLTLLSKREEEIRFWAQVKGFDLARTDDGWSLTPDTGAPIVVKNAPHKPRAFEQGHDPLKNEKGLEDLALVRTLPKPKKRKVHLSDIQAVTCKHFGVPLESISSEIRTVTVALARHCVMHLCQKHLGLSSVEIGDAFARDHTTVLAALRKVKGMLDDPESTMRDHVAGIEAVLLDPDFVSAGADHAGHTGPCVSSNRTPTTLYLADGTKVSLRFDARKTPYLAHDPQEVLHLATRPAPPRT